MKLISYQSFWGAHVRACGYARIFRFRSVDGSKTRDMAEDLGRLHPISASDSIRTRSFERKLDEVTGLPGIRG